jgi:hypothetical protein
MPPILSTATVFDRTQTQALEHGALLFLGIILFTTCAKAARKVVVVLVILVWSFASDVALLGGGLVDAEGAWSGRGYSGGTTVTYKVTFGEEFDEFVFAVTRDTARVAYSGWGVRLVVRELRRVTCQASKDGLPERTERFCASVELLLWSAVVRFRQDEQRIHKEEPRARRLRVAIDSQ